MVVAVGLTVRGDVADIRGMATKAVKGSKQGAVKTAKTTATAKSGLSLRALNRTYLARQFLLERTALTSVKVVEHIVGLQAQLPNPPYVGLWTRLKTFARDDLTTLIAQKKIVRSTMMRGTLHLVSAGDFLAHRATLQPMLSRGMEQILKDRKQTFDSTAVLKRGRELLATGPKTFVEIRDALVREHPEADERAMGFVVRMELPLVQTPASVSWGATGNPDQLLAEDWLGQKLAPARDVKALVKRYLAAFGPAGFSDFQTWSGFPAMKEVFESMRSELRVLTDERGRELFDVADGEIVDEGAKAPVRFLPEYDNVLLSHANRTRIVPEESRGAVYLPGLRVAATVLVDGFVRGAWKIERSGKSTTIVVTPCVALTAAQKEEIVDGGEKLARFVAENEGAAKVAVKFGKA